MYVSLTKKRVNFSSVPTTDSVKKMAKTQLKRKNRKSKKSKLKIQKQKTSRKQNSWSVDDATDDEDSVYSLKINHKQYLGPLHMVQRWKDDAHESEDSNESTHNDAKDETVVSDDGDRFHDETDLESEENLPIGTDFEDRFVRGPTNGSDDECMTDFGGNSQEKTASIREREANSDDRSNFVMVTSIPEDKTPGSEENQHGEEYDSDADGNVGVLNVPKILGKNPYSENVMCRYDGTKALSKRDRTTVADAIVTFALHRKVDLSAKMMLEISVKICRVFPMETPSTYFKSTAGNRKSGVLYSRYYYQRRIYNRAIEETEGNGVISDKMSDEIQEDVSSFIDILKEDGQSVECYTENWDKTHDYRIRQIGTYETLDDLLCQWPIIGKPIGLSLIDLDFQKLHGVKNITTEKWNAFFDRNWFYFNKVIKNPKGLTVCKRVSRITDGVSKDAALSFILHYVLPPALCSRLKKGEKKSRKALKGRKPSILDSKNTLLKYVKDDDINSVIANRRAQFKSKQIKPHPYIVGIGESKYKIEHFYVVIGEMKVKVSDFVTALDFCLKIFIILEIPYPPESRAVWIILNKIFFNVNVTSVMTARLCSLYNDIFK